MALSPILQANKSTKDAYKYKFAHILENAKADFYIFSRTLPGGHTYSDAKDRIEISPAVFEIWHRP